MPDDAGNGQPPRVFVTYAHDSAEHKDLVLRFSTFLRREIGLDVHLDQWYEDARRDWSVWAMHQLADADFVLVIASPDYRRRTDGDAVADDGRGAQFEGAIIRDRLLRDRLTETRRVLPVVLPGRGIDEIPTFLHAYSNSRYVVTEFTRAGAADLLAVLTGAPRVPLPPRGAFSGVPAEPVAAHQVRGRRRGARSPGAMRADLAAVVHDQWREEERFRRLQDPVPIQTRWTGCDRPELQDHWVNIGFPLPGPDLKGRLDGIAALFRRLPSRRLVVLGEPGAGKSVLAQRLTLDLLADRGADDPVPVVFRVASWHPTGEALREWLVGQLVADYPGLGASGRRGHTVAEDLIGSGGVLPVLDGLDEMSAGQRAAAIRRINAALDLGDPVVITCRVAEYAAAVAEADVITAAAVIILRTLGIDELADYLPRTARVASDTGAAGKWDPVLAFLRQADHDRRAADLLRVLGVPLMTSLARTAYSDTATTPAELCLDNRFAAPAAVANHLLDRLIPVAYDELLGDRSRWRGEHTKRWLGHLAAHDGTTDGHGIAWWRLDSVVPRQFIALVGVLVGTVGAGVPMTVLAGVPIGPVAAVAGGLASGLVTASTRPTPSIVRLRFRGVLERVGAPTTPGRIPAGWPVATVLLALALWLVAGPTGVAVALVTIVVAFGLDAWFDVPAEVTEAAGPAWLLRADRTAALTRGAARSAVIGVAVTVLAGPVAGVAFGLAAVLVSIAYTAWGRFSVVRVWLALAGKSPWRMMAFLYDAHRRGVLRQVGAIYEFRHAILRDRLRMTRGAQS